MLSIESQVCVTWCVYVFRRVVHAVLVASSTLRILLV